MNKGGSLQVVSLRQPLPVLTVCGRPALGKALVADVEGLAIYQGRAGGPSYLVVSSQGNDSFLVLDAKPPYALRGGFRIGINAALGIDGVSETDGIEVTSADLGGIYAQGLMVVQDGHKRLPDGPAAVGGCRACLEVALKRMDLLLVGRNQGQSHPPRRASELGRGGGVEQPHPAWQAQQPGSATARCACTQSRTRVRTAWPSTTSGT